MRHARLAVLIAAGLGTGLGPTSVLAQDAERQVEQGKAIYARRCAKCHGANGEGKMGPSLVGPQHHLSGYGTADVLFDYTRQVMPADRPGRMQEVEYWAVAGLSPQGERPPAAGHCARKRHRPANPARPVNVEVRTHDERCCPRGRDFLLVMPWTALHPGSSVSCDG